MVSTPKDIIKKLVVVGIYRKLPSGIETLYDTINGVDVMVDCGPAPCDKEAVYPFPYQESGESRQWIETFAHHVAKWFWKENPLPEGHEFFFAQVKMDSDSRVIIRWGSR